MDSSKSTSIENHSRDSNCCMMVPAALSSLALLIFVMKVSLLLCLDLFYTLYLSDKGEGVLNCIEPCFRNLTSQVVSTNYIITVVL